MQNKILLIILICMISFTFAAPTTHQGLEISDYTTIPASLEPGTDNVILQIDIFHTGTVTYTDISIEAIFPDEFEAIKDIAKISKMQVLDKFTVILKFNINENIDSGVYSIPIQITYKDDSGQDISYKKFINLEISDSPTLELIDITTETPYVGERFTTTFLVQNTELLPASNILASIELDDDIVSWIPSSKTIDLINEKSTQGIEFTGRISRNTKPGSYPGTLTLSYNGKTLSNKFILDVYGEPDLRVAGVSSGGDIFTGKSVSISLQLENVGKGDAGSVKVVLADDSYTGVKTSYIGTIEYDDTGSAIFDLIFLKSGVNNVKAVIFYTDKLGNERSFTTNFDILVNQTPTNYGIIIIVLILVGIGYYLYKRKEQNKKKLKKV